ncbi:MAG: plasmid stabilization protein [Rhodovulum sulfidophilum]|uniref:Plasmid stabilization protein n=1 Tax=Rhodovulum sulfidophilum TaxID=35806 RepID=A0A2W5Q5V1_RHOSU|nr:MAG: plasmid stabilization protein [Rhodovulum sulfidophilum]
MWSIEYAEAAERDFELIFDHLFAAYVDLGEEPRVALDRAADRILGIRGAIGRLAGTPFIGTSRPDIRPGLRFLRRDGAAVWFIPDAERTVVTVLAIFFGGQDHIRHMLVRGLGG